MQEFNRVDPGSRPAISPVANGSRGLLFRKDEEWIKTLATTVNGEQFKQYTNEVNSRLRVNYIDLLMTALQFELEFPDSKLPIIRKRLEDRIKSITPSSNSFIERTVGGSLQNIKANDLADILTKEELTQRVDVTAQQIKSTIVDMLLKILEFDLHLTKSQLPALRKRLEQRGYPKSIQSSITEAAVRVRWNLKQEDFADILTEHQKHLWPLTQHK